MENWKRRLTVEIVGAFVVLVSAGGGASAGSLDPPGTPGPTMRTLTEVEPRTPISALPFTITQPGSYYLTGNLSGSVGITINADDVTLDLGGFALTGVGAAGSGVSVQSPGNRKNLAVVNGTIRGWGERGVSALNVTNSRLHGLRAYGNGSTGIYFGQGAIEDCVAQSNGGGGIVSYSVVHNSVALQNTGTGISGFVIDGCVARQNTGAGIAAIDASVTITACTSRENGGDGFTVFAGTITNCSAFNNGNDLDGGNGINAFGACTIRGCTVAGNHGDGIQVSEQALVIDNTCAYNGTGSGIVGSGIHATGSRNRIESNHVTNGPGNDDFGITADSSLGGNLILRNSVGGSGGTKQDSAASADYNIYKFDGTGADANLTGTIVTNGNTGLNSGNPAINIQF
jgi:parallel beta helix pectate lyase-like protein